MKTSALTFPEIALIAGTRAMGGAGLALLLGDKLGEDQRKAVGWTLLAIAVVTTIPLLVDVLGKRR
jgi:hypothetical protein